MIFRLYKGTSELFEKNIEGGFKKKPMTVVKEENNRFSYHC